MLFYGLPADWGRIMQGAAATWSTSMPFWFIEPVSYFLVLGTCVIAPPVDALHVNKLSN